MYSFKEITQNIESDLNDFDILLQNLISGYDDTLGKILKYIFETKGKRIRPILVYLTTRMFNKPSKSTHNAAILIEIIHTATLLHDDVIDSAALRRGKPSINNKWNEKIAVLAGDFLFAKSMRIVSDDKEYKLFDIISPVIMNLTLGELIQMEYSKQFFIDESKYFEIIKYKTASLISSCCESGAYSSGTSEENIALCKEFGEILGYIFQIKDDILDYIGDNTGKEIGNDIKEKKVTLPLICAWNNMSESKQKEIVSLWNYVDCNIDNINIIINETIANKGIIGCEAIMSEYKAKALHILDKFNSSDAKSAIVKLLDYIIERDR